jgi:hypothetical protein
MAEVMGNHYMSCPHPCVTVDFKETNLTFSAVHTFIVITTVNADNP